MRKKLVQGLLCGLLVVSLIGIVGWISQRAVSPASPEELLQRYMSCLAKGDYADMYAMLAAQSKKAMTQEQFIARNQRIYEGIEAKQIQIKIEKVEQGSSPKVLYETSMDSLAGKIFFANEASFVRDWTLGYALLWDDSIIFPELTSNDKVIVSPAKAERGDVRDRKGNMLAGQGVASSVGLVPGKLGENAGDNIAKLAALLNVSPQSIQKKLDAPWVKDDYLVPIATLDKVEESEPLSPYASKEVLRNKALQEELLTIPGVAISDVAIRSYPLGEKASHLTGYIQKVTAEDLDKHQGEGYGIDDVIGRSGMEGLYEKELRGQDGYEIAIINDQGNKKKVLASIAKQDGQDIRLTIDGDLQTALYEEFQGDKSCSVALNPYTGEVLALVSTPSFDSNDFIRGLSDAQWAALNDDQKNPLYNRFRQKLCPGSSFKPIIAAIGLSTGAIDPQEDYGNVGLRWQKDASWGGYYVTTLHAYAPVVLENALIYSDNIYFAKAALKIGAKDLAKSLEALGFKQTLPFPIHMAASQYANGETFVSEIQLADSGYGQGEVLVNPLHLASLYTAFVNQGNVIKPSLLYQETSEIPIWLKQAFEPEIANQIKAALIKAVNTAAGTGYAARRGDMVLAGKTGTAEIKTTKEDNSGTELGWFCVFTTDPGIDNPILMVTMVEDVKNLGGSNYVVQKEKKVLDRYFANV